MQILLTIDAVRRRATTMSIKCPACSVHTAIAGLEMLRGRSLSVYRHRCHHYRWWSLRFRNADTLSSRRV